MPAKEIQFMPAFYRALEASKQIALYAANTSTAEHKKL
jgi:hypothetical protein